MSRLHKPLVDSKWAKHDLDYPLARGAQGLSHGILDLDLFLRIELIFNALMNNEQLRLLMAEQILRRLKLRNVEAFS